MNWIVCNYELKKGKGAKKRVSEDTSALVKPSELILFCIILIGLKE